MKYILNLEMVNMKTSKPNAFYMNSRCFGSNISNVSAQRALTP